MQAIKPAGHNKRQLPSDTRGKFIKKFDLGGMTESEIVCFPFWELNIGMGCPMVCSYCNPAGTPVLLADLTTKPIENIIPGDQVVGFTVGGIPKTIRSTVTAVSRRRSNLVRVTAGEHVFRCTPDHKWWTGRAGRLQYQSAAPGRRIKQTGAYALTPPDTPKYLHGYLCGMWDGDGSLVDKYYKTKHRKNPQRHAQVRLVLKDEDLLEWVNNASDKLLGVRLNKFEFKFSDDFGTGRMPALRSSNRRLISALTTYDLDNSEFCRGYVAGFWDAEGSYDGCSLRFYQKLEYPNAPHRTKKARNTWGRLQHALSMLGFEFTIKKFAGGVCHSIRLNGGAYQVIRFFTLVHTRCDRKRHKFWTISLPRGPNKHKRRYGRMTIDGVEPLPEKHDVYSLQTTSGNYIAHGFMSKNCFLQYSPFFNFHKKRNELYGLLHKNTDELSDELEKWCERHKESQSLIVGELQDGLAFDDAYHKQDGVAMTRRIYEVIKKYPRHLVVFLSKSTLIKHILKLKPIPNIVWSWSMTTPSIWRKYETKKRGQLGVSTAHPHDRAKVASILYKKGWRIRFRVSPMLPVGGWRREYPALFRRMEQSKPELVTANGLLASRKTAAKNSAIRNGRDGSVFDYLTHYDGNKWRVDPQLHLQLLKMVEEFFGRRSALCKERISVWQQLGYKWDGCHCLNTKKDPVVFPRWKQIKPIHKVAKANVIQV